MTSALSMPTQTTDQMIATRARDLTDKIKAGVEGIWQLITEAYTSRAWSALGYPSWDEYCTREFGTSRLGLPREERMTTVRSLRDSGLSIRAITAATGISDKTVMRDLRQVSETTTPAQAPAPPAMITSAGMRQPTSDPVAAIRRDDEPLRAGQCEQLEVESAGQQVVELDPLALLRQQHERKNAKIIGIDGKAYGARRQPAPPRAERPPEGRVTKGPGTTPSRRSGGNLTRKRVVSIATALERWGAQAVTGTARLDGRLTPEEAPEHINKIREGIKTLNQLIKLLEERANGQVNQQQQRGGCNGTGQPLPATWG